MIIRLNKINNDLYIIQGQLLGQLINIKKVPILRHFLRKMVGPHRFELWTP